MQLHQPHILTPLPIFILCQQALLVLSASAKKLNNKNPNFKCSKPLFEQNVKRTFMLGDASFVFPVSLTDQNANCR